MADHVMNMLQIESEDKDFIERFKYAFTTPTEDGEASFLDFEKVIPTPAELLIKQKPGTMDRELYQWRCDNWGTKWNSWNEYKFKGEDNQIFFTTAWCPPYPIIEKLSTLCPDVYLTLISFDEANENGTFCIFHSGTKRLTNLKERPLTERLLSVVSGKEKDVTTLLE